jgi:type IV secretion system protein VirB7
VGFFIKGAKMRYMIFVVILCFVLTGCTYAGPFITNVSQNKDGTLTIEKCLVEHNGFGIATTNCTIGKI